jgi:hypothetical protein
MNRFCFSLCVLSIAVFSAPGIAGDSPPQGNDAAIVKLVEASSEAAKKGDWEKYAGFIHPQSLEDYKKMWQPALTAAAKQGPEQQAELVTLFDNAADLKSISALKPKEFFISSMKAISSQFGQRLVGSPIGNEKIIGVVHDGDDQAYVVVRVRQKFNGAELTKVDVVALKRSGTEWRMELPDVVRTLADTFGGHLPKVERSRRADTPDPEK